jgi:hypothetical protein
MRLGIFRRNRTTLKIFLKWLFRRVILDGPVLCETILCGNFSPTTVICFYFAASHP